MGRLVVDAVHADPALPVELDGRAYRALRREMRSDRHRGDRSARRGDHPVWQHPQR